jgi:general secretion pathway protein A
MYLGFYQLKLKPFQISCDPKFLWLGEKHSEALATLRYGIMEDKGFLLLTGDVGTGKTALIRHLVNMIEVAALVATVPDPGLEAIDFFNYLAEEFQMQRKFSTKGDFLIEFKQFLHKAYSTQQKVLLIIDEAQRLNHDLLEQIRLLSNIELDNRKLINIFFVGQTEFNRMLLEERNRAVRQRITVSYFIQPLTEAETQHYIRHRLRVAGGRREVFSPDAMRRIFSFSRGYPRLINIICDHALLSGYALGAKTIDVDLIRECEKELNIPDGSPSSPTAEPASGAEKDRTPERPGNRRVAAVLVFMLLLIFGVMMIYQYQSDEGQRWKPEEIAPQSYKGLSAVRPPAEEAAPRQAETPRAPAESAAERAAGRAPAEPAAAAAPEATLRATPDPFSRGRVVIRFQFNSNELTPEALDALDAIAEYLVSRPKLHVRINGYTDSTGSETYNLNVSQFRANSIKSYLAGKGVDASRLTAAGLGSRSPMAPNDTPEGRERNRRVEIEPASN